MAEVHRCFPKPEELELLLEAKESHHWDRDGKLIDHMVELSVTALYCKLCGHTWEEPPFKLAHYRPMRPE